MRPSPRCVASTRSAGAVAHVERRVDRAARFSPGDAEVVTVHVQHRKAREQRVAVLLPVPDDAQPRHARHAELGRQVVELQRLVARVAAVLHLLQRDDVRADLAQHAGDARRVVAAIGADAPMDVVRDDGQGHARCVHVSGPVCCRRNQRRTNQVAAPSSAAIAADQRPVHAGARCEQGLDLVREHRRRERARRHADRRADREMPELDAQRAGGEPFDRERGQRHESHRRHGEQAATPQHVDDAGQARPHHPHHPLRIERAADRVRGQGGDDQPGERIAEAEPRAEGEHREQRDDRAWERGSSSRAYRRAARAAASRADDRIRVPSPRPAARSRAPRAACTSTQASRPTATIAIAVSDQRLLRLSRAAAVASGAFRLALVVAAEQVSQRDELDRRFGIAETFQRAPAIPAGRRARAAERAAARAAAVIGRAPR